MNRRQFLAATILTATTTSSLPAAPQTQPSSKPSLPDNLTWHDPRDWGLEGKAFTDTENYFDRLPARAKDEVPSAVWYHSKSTAGMSTRFTADTDSIYIRYQLTRSALAMPHMPATGVSGLDLYAQTNDAQNDNTQTENAKPKNSQNKKTWHWLATYKPRTQSIADLLVTGLLPGKRNYQLNLPLYNGVTSLQIGLPKAATFEPTPPRKQKPILFYGTSITQGGVASRPGMAFVSILGRRLNRPMLNFGFSGSGRMETEVGQYFAELDPAIYVIDCLANMSTVPIESNCKALIHQLRQAHPVTPILLLEDRLPPAGDFLPHLLADHRRICAAQKSAYDALIAEGIKNLHYQTGEAFLGPDAEATVDGDHPSDLGMQRYADALEPILRKLLPT